MSFCKLCGAEIKTGKNFCSRCGTPVDKPGESSLSSSPNPNVPPSPPPPQQDSSSNLPIPVPPLSSAKPAQSWDKIIIAGILGAAIIAMIIFIGLPLLTTQGTNSHQSADTSRIPSVSPVSGPGRTTSPSFTTRPADTVPAASSGTIVYRSGEAYEQVYSRDYNGDTVSQDVFSYNLQQPPLIIECEMNPKMVSREKLVDIDKSTERYITTTYADPNAWLDLKVIDADTGGITTTISFSKNYVGMTKQEYTIRSPGNYRFEWRGSQVSPSIRLLLKK
jgi:hypothetical protein